MRETADSAGAEAGETISSIVEFLPKNHTGTTRGGPSNLPYFSDFVKLLPVGLLCRNLPTNKRKRGKNERSFIPHELRKRTVVTSNDPLQDTGAYRALGYTNFRQRIKLWPYIVGLYRN